MLKYFQDENRNVHMNSNLPPELITAGTWLWENLGKEILNALSTKAQKQWEKVEWGLAAKRYKENMYDLYSTIRMLGNPQPVPLEGIYTDVYMLDKPTAFRRYDIEKLKNEYEKDGFDSKNDFRLNALDLVRSQERLFILGKPGAGKTTL